MSFPVPDFSAEAIQAAKSHALESWPRESCGLIVAGVYAPCRNTAEDPEKDFRIDPIEIIKAGKNLDAVIHSHPRGHREPSAADMRGQIDTGCIWGIIPCNQAEAFAPVFWGDFMLEEAFGPDGKPRQKGEPLIGREFIHGISDCGTLIRAWYWQQEKILIPEFPRDDDWWKAGENIYLDSFARAGFRVIGMKDARPGDVVLGRVRSQVPNHGGVILDRGLIHHHIANRSSRREPLGPWMKYITHWLRHDNASSV